MRSNSAAYVDERLRAAQRFDERLRIYDDGAQKSRRPRPCWNRIQEQVGGRQRGAAAAAAALVLMVMLGLYAASSTRAPTTASTNGVITPRGDVQRVGLTARSLSGQEQMDVIRSSMSAPPSMDLQQQRPPQEAVAAAATATAEAAGPSRLPPYSTEGDCRRDYDRQGRGDGFARCGSSCCRSHAGIACYYKADAGLCDRFLAAADAGGTNGGGTAVGGGPGVDTDAGRADRSDRRIAGGVTPDDGGGPDPQAFKWGGASSAAAASSTSVGSPWRMPSRRIRRTRYCPCCVWMQTRRQSL